MGMSAAHCQGNVREFQSVWRVVTMFSAVFQLHLGYLGNWNFRSHVLSLPGAKVT